MSRNYRICVTIEGNQAWGNTSAQTEDGYRKAAAKVALENFKVQRGEKVEARVRVEPDGMPETIFDERLVLSL